MSYKDRPPLTSSNLVNILREHGYTNWDSLARELHVSLDFRRRLKQKVSRTQDHHTALKEVLQHWLERDSNYSWTVLLNAIDKTEEREVAQVLRKANLRTLGSNSSTVNTASSSSSSSSSAASSSSTIESRALRSFLKLQDNLLPLIQISINEFSSKLFSRDLLPDEIYDKLYESTPASESERAGYLVYSIFKQVSGLEAEGKITEAKELIRQFGKVVYDTDCALRYTGGEIMSYRDSIQLMSNQDSIKCSIQSSLTSIAAKLMSKDLISEEDYNSITDPDYDHIKRFTTEVFRSLREAIKQDYTVYRSLVKVIKDMGPPISTAAARIIDSEFF